MLVCVQLLQGVAYETTALVTHSKQYVGAHSHAVSYDWFLVFAFAVPTVQFYTSATNSLYSTYILTHSLRPTYLHLPDNHSPMQKLK